MNTQVFIYLFNLYVKKCLLTLNLSDLFFEQDTRIQGQVRVASINKFKHQLEEGKAVTLQGYSLGEIQPKFRIVKKGLWLSFLSTTIVEPCPDFTGSIHGFQFRPFNWPKKGGRWTIWYVLSFSFAKLAIIQCYICEKKLIVLFHIPIHDRPSGRMICSRIL